VTIDQLAYEFWALHPKQLDEYEPPMPEGYRGGMRAWFYACEMKKLVQPKGWFVKDFADGWIYFDNETDALREVAATGAIMLIGIKPE